MGIVNVTKQGPEAFVDNDRVDDYDFTTGLREFKPPYQPRVDYRTIIAWGIVGVVSFIALWVVYGFWKIIYCWERNYDTCIKLNGAEPWVFATVFGSLVCLVVANIVVRIVAFERQTRAVANRTNLVLDRFGDQQPANLFNRISNEELLGFLTQRYLIANNLEQAIAPHKLYRSVNSLSLNNSIQNAAPTLTTDDAQTIEPILPDEWLKWINEKPHFMIAGKTGEGKSVTAKAILAARFVPNTQFMIIDPQSNGWFNFATIGNGWHWGEIIDAIIALHDEYMQRHAVRAEHLRDTNQGLPVDHFSRLNILMDEAFEISKKLDTGSSKTKTNYWDMYAATLGSGARIVNMGAGILTQTANVEDIGLSGPLRANFTRIAIDPTSIKLMIKQEETDRARRELLYSSLLGMQYPATTVVGMGVELLDRTGLDKLAMPHVGAAHVWPFVRSQTPSSNGNGVHRTNEPTNQDQLSALKRQGITRHDARFVHGIRFSDEDWTDA